MNKTTHTIISLYAGTYTAGTAFLEGVPDEFLLYATRPPFPHRPLPFTIQAL
jgi:hypothetical protein